MAPLRGVWKISTVIEATGRAVAKHKEVPKFVRFCGADGGTADMRMAMANGNWTANQPPPPPGGGEGVIELPYDETGRFEAQGSWSIEAVPAPKALGARRVTFDIGCAREETLYFDGLFDGERMAGGIAFKADKEYVGEFLCTRLYTFWGPPKVAAADREPKEEEGPPMMTRERLLDLQFDMCALDVPIEDEMLGWTEAEAEAFFESGGEERPRRG